MMSTKLKEQRANWLRIDKAREMKSKKRLI
jgi:hypothetical protein